MMRGNNFAAMVTLIACTLVTLMLGGCTGYGEEVKEGPWSAYIGESDAFVYEYRWDGTKEGLRIEPGTINGLPVTRYGGYMGRGVPCPFHVDIPGATFSRQNIVPREEIVDTIEFTLVVGSRIRDFNLSNYGLGGYYLLNERKDGKNAYYKVLIHPEVDPANSKYYEKDGKLYIKSDDSLVRNICYELEEMEKPAIREKRVTNAEGKVKVYEYDPDGIIQQETEYEAGGAVIRKTSYMYMEKDWLSTKLVTDAQGKPIRYEHKDYDAKGNITAIYEGTSREDAALNRTYLYMDGKLTLESNLNADGTIYDLYQYEYNDKDQLVSKTQKSEDGYVYRNWKYEYDDAGKLSHVTDTYYEHRIEYFHDENERVILEEGYFKDQPSYSKKQVYGPFGITDSYFERADSEVVTHEKIYYDDLGRRVSTASVNPEGEETQTAFWEYDANGNLLHHKAAKGYEYTAEYNEYGYPVKSHDVCTDMLRDAGVYDIQEEIEYLYYSSPAK